VLGAPLLIDVLGDLANFQDNASKQPDSGVTYAEKITKSEALIDWTQSAVVLDRRIRAFNPTPVCYTELDGERIRVWASAVINGAAAGHPPGTVVAASETGLLVQCGDGQLAITRLQLPGGRPLEAGQVLHSKRDSFTPGVRFGQLSADG
jgi:methionyl-tRNA formyltransferase